MLRGLASPVAIFFAFILFSAVPYIVRADDASCPTGAHPATGADVVLMKSAGINGAVVGMCWDPNDKYVGQSDAEAKQFLISLYTNPGTCSQKGLSNPRVEGIQKLDSQFAVNLAALLKAAPMSITINSAFRTPEAQQCANPKVQSSNHSRGCAVDLGYNQNTCSTAACQWIVANASRFNLVIRMRYAPEWNHIEPTSCAGKSTGAVVTNGTYSNTEDANQSTYPIVPNTTTSYPGAPVPTVSTPVSTLPATTQTTQTTSTGASLCTPAFSCSNNVMYYQTTSCTTQVYQTCTSGCNGNSCATIAPSTGTSTLVLGTSTVQASSTMDLLNSLSSNVSLSATPIGTATPLALALNGNTSDVTQLGGNTSSIVTPGTIASIQPITAQQTFTSTDLGTNGTYTGTGSQQSSGLSKILSDLHAALTWALGYLRSLRGA